MKVNQLEITQENLDTHAVIIDSPYGTAYVDLDSNGAVFVTNADGSTATPSDAYTKAQTDSKDITFRNSACTYSDGQTRNSLSSYYNKVDCNESFLSANTALFTAAEADTMYLSANTFIPTDFYSQAETNGKITGGTMAADFSTLVIKTNVLTPGTFQIYSGTTLCNIVIDGDSGLKYVVA